MSVVTSTTWPNWRVEAKFTLLTGGTVLDEALAVAKLEQLGCTDVLVRRDGLQKLLVRLTTPEINSEMAASRGIVVIKQMLKSLHHEYGGYNVGTIPG